jgi:hypothetical protein
MIIDIVLRIFFSPSSAMLFYLILYCKKASMTNKQQHLPIIDEEEDILKDVRSVLYDDDDSLTPSLPPPPPTTNKSYIATSSDNDKKGLNITSSVVEHQQPDSQEIVGSSESGCSGGASSAKRNKGEKNVEIFSSTTPPSPLSKSSKMMIGNITRKDDNTLFSPLPETNRLQHKVQGYLDSGSNDGESSSGGKKQDTKSSSSGAHLTGSSPINASNIKSYNTQKDFPPTPPSLLERNDSLCLERADSQETIKSMGHEEGCSSSSVKRSRVESSKKVAISSSGGGRVIKPSTANKSRGCASIVGESTTGRRRKALSPLRRSQAIQNIAIETAGNNDDDGFSVPAAQQHQPHLFNFSSPPLPRAQQHQPRLFSFDVLLPRAQDNTELNVPAEPAAQPNLPTSSSTEAEDEANQDDFMQRMEALVKVINMLSASALL